MYVQIPWAVSLIIPSMIDKTLYFEQQKLSLALFLATKGSAGRLFIDDDNQPVNNPVVKEPFPEIEAEDRHTRLHVQHFCTSLLLQKTYTRASECQQIIEAWRSYCDDCMIDGQSMPLLDLVQGWTLSKHCNGYNDEYRQMQVYAASKALSCADAILRRSPSSAAELSAATQNKNDIEPGCCR